MQISIQGRKDATMCGDHEHEHQHGHDHSHQQVDWRKYGVKIIPGNALDPNTAQTPGMNRATAINHARAGAERSGREP